MPHPEAPRPNSPCGTAPTDRRRREVLITMALAGAAALMTGVPLGLYAVAPTLGQSIDKWIDLGPVGDLPEDGFAMRSYEFLIKDGWLVLPQRGFVWARRGPDGKAQVFSSTCTHLACNVIWQGATGTFECPCHSGKFDAEGRPIAGPPTRPLKALEYTLEADMLKVHMTV